MWPISKKAGFSVIELVVAMGVMLLLLGCLATLVMAASRYHQQSRAFQQVLMQANLALRNLVDQLQNSRPGQWAFGALPSPHVIFLSTAPPYPAAETPRFDANGQLVWQKYSGYRLQSGNMLRDELVPAGLPSPTPGTLPGYADFSWTGVKTRLVGRNIDSFLVEPGITLETLNVVLSAREETSSTRATRMILRTQVFLKNRF